MKQYIAVIRPDSDGCYSVSFPDLPGVVTAGDTPDEALSEAVEALAFAAADWADDTGEAFPEPRTLEDIRRAPEFQHVSADAVVVAVPLTSIMDDDANDADDAG